MIDFSDLLGVPYKHHGRSHEGMDCYGLVIDYEQRLGREVFDLDYKARDYRKGSEYSVWEKSMKRWKEVSTPKTDDVLLFFDKRGQVIHAAVYIGSGKILHCDVQGVRVERLDGFYYKNWKVYEWLR